MLSFIGFAVQYLAYTGSLLFGVSLGCLILFNAGCYFLGSIFTLSLAIAIVFAVCLFYSVTREFFIERGKR